MIIVSPHIMLAATNHLLYDGFLKKAGIDIKVRNLGRVNYTQIRLSCSKASVQIECQTFRL